jgi:hypothetical protein
LNWLVPNFQSTFCHFLTRCRRAFHGFGLKWLGSRSRLVCNTVIGTKPFLCSRPCNNRFWAVNAFSASLRSPAVVGTRYCITCQPTSKSLFWSFMSKCEHWLWATHGRLFAHNSQHVLRHLRLSSPATYRYVYPRLYIARLHRCVLSAICDMTCRTLPVHTRMLLSNSP